MGILIIKDVIAVTMDASRRIITDASIAIEDDTIIAIGKSDAIASKFVESDRKIEGWGRIALPGLIDAHAHSPQAMLRGVADDLPWRPYLEDYIWPLQGSYDPDDADISLQLCILEMITTGTTCYVDPLVHSRYDFDRQATTIERMGHPRRDGEECDGSDGAGPTSWRYQRGDAGNRREISCRGGASD